MAHVELYKDLEKRVAGVIAKNPQEIDEVADRLAAVARRKAAGHGSLARDVKIDVEGNGKDREVVMTHPAAGPVEFGHVLIDNRSGSPIITGRWVPGLHIMRDTFQEEVSWNRVK
jgi:hypothetical protein